MCSPDEDIQVAAIPGRVQNHAAAPLQGVGEVPLEVPADEGRVWVGFPLATMSEHPSNSPNRRAQDSNPNPYLNHNVVTSMATIILILDYCGNNALINGVVPVPYTLPP